MQSEIGSPHFWPGEHSTKLGKHSTSQRSSSTDTDVLNGDADSQRAP